MAEPLEHAVGASKLVPARAGARALAVIGAESLLGREILDAIEELAPRALELRLLSEKPGREQPFRGGELEVARLGEGSFAGVSAAIFAPGAARAGRWIPGALAAGASVVDLSAAHRLDPEVALLRPAGASGPRHVSIPGAPALVVARALGPLWAKARIERVEATLVIPASGAGSRGVRELSRQTGGLLGSRRIRARRFPHRIAFNVIPEVMGFEGADDRSELSFAAELRRLLGSPGLAIASTALRAPLFFGLLAVLSLTLERELGPAEARELARGGPGLQLLDDPSSHVYPMPSLATGDAAVQVGRIRSDAPRHLQLVAAADPARLLGRAAVEAALLPL